MISENPSDWTEEEFNQQADVDEREFASKVMADLGAYLDRARILANSIPEDWDEWSEGNEIIQNVLDSEWEVDAILFSTLDKIYQDNQMTPSQKSHYEETINILRQHKQLLEKMDYYIPDVIK